MIQIQYTKNLNPGRFELGTTLSEPNRSIARIFQIWSTPFAAHPDFPDTLIRFRVHPVAVFGDIAKT